MNTLAVLVQSYAKARRTKVPLVVLLDEAESVWGAPADNPLQRQIANLVAAYMAMLEKLARSEKVPVYFIGTTNYPERVSPPLDATFIEQPAASRTTLERIVMQQLRQLDECLGRLGRQGPAFATATYAQNVAAALHIANLGGRDADACVQKLRNTIIGSLAAEGRYTTDTVERCLQLATQATVSQRARRGTSPAPQLLSHREVFRSAHASREGASARRMSLQEGLGLMPELAKLSASMNYCMPDEAVRQKTAVDRFQNAIHLLLLWNMTAGIAASLDPT